jgi:hypothetical protein
MADCRNWKVRKRVVEWHLANTPTRSSGLALATVRAPRSALYKEHAPINMGSPSLAAALSIEQQSMHISELLRMCRSAPELCNAEYTPPLPSGAVAICNMAHRLGTICTTESAADHSFHLQSSYVPSRQRRRGIHVLWLSTSSFRFMA